MQRDYTINVAPGCAELQPASGTYSICAVGHLERGGGHHDPLHGRHRHRGSRFDPTATTGTLYSGPVRNIDSTRSSRRLPSARRHPERGRAAHLHDQPAARGAECQPGVRHLHVGAVGHHERGGGHHDPLHDRNRRHGARRPDGDHRHALQRPDQHPDSTQTIKAASLRANGRSSTVVQRSYTINLPPAAPSVSLASGTYTSTQSVTMSAAAGHHDPLHGRNRHHSARRPDGDHRDRSTAAR